METGDFLTLLKAYVHDFLLDWNPNLEMEHGLTYSMLGVRVVDVKGARVESQHFPPGGHFVLI